MPSSGVSMPTIRSPGKAPVSGAKRIGKFDRWPRTGNGVALPGMATAGFSWFGFELLNGRNRINLLRLNQRSVVDFSSSAGVLLGFSFGASAAITSLTGNCPRPTAARTPSREFWPSFGKAALSASSEYPFSYLLRARVRISRPRPVYCARTASRVARRMAARAFPVTAYPSHAAGGTCDAERMISTSSPLFNLPIKGALRPLIRQPTQLSPTSVCTA